MDSTTETLFSENNSENKPFYVGRRVGGLFSPLSDYYAQELSKIREDYQLEPSLVVRDSITNTPDNVLFYEDLLTSLGNDGVNNNDISNLFDSARFSYAPPIDMDMFVNYSDYYWYPEGGFSIEVNASVGDLEGRINATVQVSSTGEALNVSSGMNLTLDDNKTYIIEGVGTYITLIEFDLESNKPCRIDRIYNSNTLADSEIIDRFPAEYMTMHRGSSDMNPWSRNNSWFHKDVINKIIGNTRFFADRERRAERPIICFSRDIELFNYGIHRGFVRSIDNSLDINHGGVILRAGDHVISYGDDKVYSFNGATFDVEYTVEHGEKVTISDGVNKADEFRWDAVDMSWEMCQRKLHTNQPILFNLYDTKDESNATLLSDEFKYPNSTFKGTEIFKYATSSSSLEDPVLGIGLKYKAFKESSDIVFENTMDTQYTYGMGDDVKTMPSGFFRINNPNLIEEDNIIKITIGKDGTTSKPVIFINGKHQETFVVKANTQYRVDITDSSTTVRGWSNKYSPVSIISEDGTEIMRPTHADSSKNDVLVSFSETNAGGHIIKTAYDEGRIFAVAETVTNSSFCNGWKESDDRSVTLKLEKVLYDGDDLAIPLTYTPTSDNEIRLSYNGDVLSSSDYYFDVSSLVISKNVEVVDGDFVEVEYTTHDNVMFDSDEIQLIHPSLNNNPYNAEIEDFAYSEVFEHFRSIIRNQPFLVGTALTDNNYRDTIKDLSRGNAIMKHESNIVPLMFANMSDQTNTVEALITASQSYQRFKDSIVINSSEFIKNNDVNDSNVRDIFDDIIDQINSGRRKSDPYAYSYMFATYNKYTNVTFSDTGVCSEYINVGSDDNELYIYTNNGLMLVDIDYNIVNDVSTMTTTLTPLTFSFTDITEVRYYQDMEPSFCAPTPMKFGLGRPTQPQIILDDTYTDDRYFIVGHDGSKTLCYSSSSDIILGDIDGRDLILLEFEKRIYNGIRPEFKDERKSIINLNDVTPSYYKTLNGTKSFIEDVEFKFFSKWCNDNNVDYTENTLYDVNDTNTYNFPVATTSKGVEVAGHWKALFQYYYGTVTPHVTPWEMLEFKIKPSWWDSEYGSNYSSNNVKMWTDIEKGIVRQGNRANLMFEKYRSSSNRLQKPRLTTDIHPVDGDGKPRDVVDIGLVSSSEFNEYQVKRSWKFGEYGPVEQAWRNSSEYAFVKQVVYYIIKPLVYVSQSWDTTYSFNLPVGDVHVPSELGVHSLSADGDSGFNYVPGLSQWLYSFLQTKNMSGEKIIRDYFYDSDVQLSHKVGGFIDTQDLKISTETFNPRSDSNVLNVPSEDISVMMHESKDIGNEVYSGVLIERIDADKTYYNFKEGTIYDINDIVYRPEEKNYYRLTKDYSVFHEWDSFFLFSVGRVVRYANRLYECLEEHRSDDMEFPTNSNKWSLRAFNQSDWALLTSKPDAKTTYFKVYGYDIYDSGFKTIPKSSVSREQDISTATLKSKPVTVLEWEPNTKYSEGQYVRINEGNLFVCRKAHTSSEVFDNTFWVKSDKNNFTNMANVTVSVDGDYSKVQTIPYGTVFRTEKEVADFLLSYGRYLEHTGWVFDSFDKTRNKYKNWTLSVEEFIRWAYENKQAGSVIGLSPMSEDIKLRTKHGVPSVTRNNVNTPVSLMGAQGQIIDPSTVEYDRTDGVYKIISSMPIFYCRISIKEYEHVVVVNNRTVFNDVIYEPELGIRKDRLMIRATKTKNWDGRIHAEGFIVLGDKLLPNFETSISDLTTIGDTHMLSVSDTYNRLKFHNYGYEKRQYLENLSMDDKSQIAFYEGFVRQKGTSEAFQRLLRSSELDVSDDMQINEEWAFKEGTYGSIETEQMVEVEFDKTDMRSTPQPVYFEYLKEFDNKKATDVYVNINDTDTWITRPSLLSNGKMLVETDFSNVKKVPTAGYVRWADAVFKAFDIKTVNSSIKESNRSVDDGLRVWMAKDSSDEYGWNLYHSSTADVSFDEIITLGKENVSSAVMKISGSDVSEDYVYGIYDNDYLITFFLKKIDPNDSIYILLPFNEDEYTVFDSQMELSELNDMKVTRWLPSRINRFYNNFYEDVQNTIDEFLTKNSIAPDNGMRLYIDNINSPVSYRSVIDDMNPREYWSFDEYQSGEFAGINGTPMVPQDTSSVASNVSGVYNSLSVSGTSTFNGSDWPNAVWADLGTLDNGEKALEFWVSHDGNLMFQNAQAFSYTFGAIVIVDETNETVMSTQVGVYPETLSEAAGYRTMHIIDGQLDYSAPVPIESGFNHVVINTTTSASGVDVQTIINGTIVDHNPNVGTVGYGANYKLYVVGIDTAEQSSDMPMIDEMAIYDKRMTLTEAQDHYDSGINGIFGASEDTKWGVFEYNDGQWGIEYTEEPVIDTNLIHEALIYNKEDKSYINNLMINDPVKGYFAGARIQDIDYITEYDPAVYNSKSKNYSNWGSSKLGYVWWDTSTMRYLEYENGTAEDRINFWGTLFPESSIDVYEWVQSPDIPVDYVKDKNTSGVPYDLEHYTIEETYDEDTQETTKRYYFWAKNTTTIPKNIERKVSTVSIANAIRYPENNGVNYINFIDNECVLLNDITNNMVQNDFTLQIKYRTQYDDVQTHTQWTLISEDDREDDIPPFLFDKMIDSILGYTDEELEADAKEVPDMSLPHSNRYGNSISPLQGWFINIKKARKNFFEAINEALSGMNIWDVELFWERLGDDLLRDTKYYSLVDWYKDNYDPSTIVSNLVNKRVDIMTTKLEDGEYVKVNESEGRMPSVYESGFTIYRYLKDINSYEKVAQSRSAIKFKESFYKDDFSFEDATDIRNILNIIFDVFIDSARPEFINRIFFTMVRYVLSEQPTNDWVFPATYINVNQESRNLIKKRIYQNDKEKEIVEYITEAKPFHTKLREVKKIATGDIEYNGFYVTDFDKPPFITDDRDILILQEELIDTIPYKRDLYYNLSIRNAKPVEYWPMNVKYFSSTIEGSFGNNFYNRDGDFYTRPSGISFNNGFVLEDVYSTNDINIASSKITAEAWLYGHDVSILGGESSFEVMNLKITNSSDTSDSVDYKVIMYNVNGVAEFHVEAHRGSVVYLDEVVTMKKDEMNYFVFGIDHSSLNSKLNLSLNGDEYETYNLGNFININGFYDAAFTIGDKSIQYFYDEFALYSRALDIDVVRLHHDFASQTVEQRIFTLENEHDMDTVNVFVEGAVLSKNEYTIYNNTLKLAEPLDHERAYRHVSNIVVKSTHIAHRDILSEYDQARGYRGISKTNLSQWKQTVNQKRTHLMYDRVSVTPTMSLEELLNRHNIVKSSVDPRRAFSEQSYKFSGFSGQKFTETDRIASHFYSDKLESVVNASYTEKVNAPYKKNFVIGDELPETDVAVFIDEQHVAPRDYTITSDTSGVVTVSMYFNVKRNSIFAARPKADHEDLMFNIMHHRGVGIPFKNLDEIREIGFVIDATTSPVRYDSDGELTIDSDYVDIMSDSGHDVSLDIMSSDFDDDVADIKSSDKFLRNAEKAIPEEKTELNLKEAIVTTFKTNLKIVQRGFETATGLEIFESVTFKASGGETEYSINLNVPEEQILVIVNGDEWVNEGDNTGGRHHYSLSASTNKIYFNKTLHNGDEVVITDRYSAYDQYQGREMHMHTNIQTGGYDGNIVCPEFLNDNEDKREFIIYTQDGKVHVFSCPESESYIVDSSIGYASTTIELNSNDIVSDDMALSNNKQGKLAVIYANKKPEDDTWSDIEKKEYRKLLDTKIEFVYYTSAKDSTISGITRGLFGKNAKDFDINKYNITVYPLTIDDSLPSFTITEPYVGVKGKLAYPKYGHIMSGKD